MTKYTTWVKAHSSSVKHLICKYISPKACPLAQRSGDLGTKPLSVGAQSYTNTICISLQVLISEVQDKNTRSQVLQRRIQSCICIPTAQTLQWSSILLILSRALSGSAASRGTWTQPQLLSKAVKEYGAKNTTSRLPDWTW